MPGKGNPVVTSLFDDDHKNKKDNFKSSSSSSKSLSDQLKRLSSEVRDYSVTYLVGLQQIT